MPDFMSVCVSMGKNGVDIYPKFIVKKSKDLMIRGGDFYAVWCEEKGLWSTDEDDVVKLVDKELDICADKYKGTGDPIHVKHMWDGDSGVIDRWHKYCQRQLRDNYNSLDDTLTFSNTEVKKTDYVSKRLPYPLEEGVPEAWNALIGVLYSPEEKHKIEWIIGAIVSGASRDLQKFAVLYGAMGTGKSTVIDIFEWLFEGYYTPFDAKALGSSSDQFSLEPFKDNPLVAIQHDGNLSKIEDNTRLNSLVSHEKMTVNEKRKTRYSNQFKTFLIMGTNNPVKITDAKSGIIRRLIDISPTGNLVPKKEYVRLKAQIKFELGKLASYCLNIFNEDPSYYDDYIPLNMMAATNDFYNFVEDQYLYFKREDEITLKSAWELYKNWCDDAKITYPFSLRIFKEEMKNYFREFKERAYTNDEDRVRNLYCGFRTEKFEKQTKKLDREDKKQIKAIDSWIVLKEQKSLLDILYKDQPAQYANDEGKPIAPWSKVETTLSDISTDKVHYVLPPKDKDRVKNHIFIDFDLRDENGNKSLVRNIEAASKFPKTYAEVSKGGEGLHLHYIYVGNVGELSSLYDEGIEVKTMTGNSALRRKLTKCNDIPVAEISSGLPLKEVKVVEDFRIKSEQHLRARIKKALNKEIHPDTTSNINYIFDQLEQMYNSGEPYDVTDLRNAVCAFAAGSTNQSDACLKKAMKMHFKSQDDTPIDIIEAEIVFFDVEVFSNLFVVCWKKEGADSVIRMINPRPSDIEVLLKYRLVGFNNRKYDNHILYARLMGYSNEALYELSQNIITSKDKNVFFNDAYNLSYTDIYDFASEKKSLKKWEIELGIHHVELSIPWDQPVPEKLWDTVADYCCNDVLATEAVWNARQDDFKGREIISDLSGLTVNDTNNQHTTRIIFEKERSPQSEFNYRFMGIDPKDVDKCTQVPAMDCDWNYTCFKDDKCWFPGYTFSKDDKGHWVSMYRGEEVGEGGYVYAEPGIYYNVALLDIASMHPSSIVAENLFGNRYTKKFKQLLDIRLMIKHEEFDKLGQMFDGKLKKYLTNTESASALSKALKIPINSVYGLTSAKFPNPFRDPRNVDNIVAKRGALFMINLKHEVQARGYTVAHIKTDSIKIPNATPEIIKFVYDYGQLYGYTFEHEATYERMALVNNAVYIARYADPEKCKKLYGYSPSDNVKAYKKHPETKGWTATGAQFDEPFIFKSLFSHQPVDFYDKCQTINVSSKLYLDMNEGLPDVTAYENEYKKRLKADPNDPRLDILKEEIDKGHNYKFIGRVGLFTPVINGGGELVRSSDNSINGFAYPSGTKGFRWIDAEQAKAQNLDIDILYYRNLVDDALDAIRNARKSQLDRHGIGYTDDTVEDAVTEFMDISTIPVAEPLPF